MSFDLFIDDGEHFRSVRVGIQDDQLRVDTHDMGPTARAFWGDSEYEFWTIVEKEHWGDLAVALIREFLSGDRKAGNRMENLCCKYGVPHESDRWS